MLNLGFGEILLILVFVLLFIGPKKLPGLAKGLGKGMKEFNDALRGITSTDPPKPDEAVSENTSKDSSEASTANAQGHDDHNPVDDSDLDHEHFHHEDLSHEEYHDDHIHIDEAVAENHTEKSKKKS